MATRINQLGQEFSPGKLVDLFILDMTPLGQGFLRFSSTTDGAGGIISWNGDLYVPTVSEMTDVQYTAVGQLPRPRLRIQNLTGAVIAASLANDDLIGMELTRIRTYEIFLDGGAEPDPDQHFPPEIWLVNRLTEQNNVFSEWELANPMDQQGRILPGRQIVREGCSHVYRKFDTASGTFKGEFVTCPYNRAASFDRNGNSLGENHPDDRCGKKLRDCKVRFNLATDTLPLLSFPGVGTIR